MTGIVVPPEHATAPSDQPHKQVHEPVEVYTASPKLDPETVVLRARPSRAIRFKRKVIIGGAAIVALACGGVGYIALRPSVGHLVHSDDDRSVAATTTPDALQALPASYGDVPRLRPPLPGDLGRGILEHQRATLSQSPGAASPQLDQTAVAARERQLAEVKAARESGLLVQAQGRTDAVAAAPAIPASPASGAGPAEIAVAPEHDPNAQQRKADFVDGTDKGGDVNPHALIAPRSP